MRFMVVLAVSLAFWNALQKQETGMKPPPYARGDGGKARGPYQIWEAYAVDAGHSWKECDTVVGSRRVMLDYWKRYCPKALKKSDYQTLARVHNGGPAGYRKKATVKYWNSVKRRMK